MSNNAAGLRTLLQYAVKDTADATWSSTEKDNSILASVRGLYPRLLFPLVSQDYTETLVDGTYFYVLDPAIVALSRVDYVDANGQEAGPLDGSVWDIDGNLQNGPAYIKIAPTIAALGGSVRYVGYGKYDVVTNLIPDELVPLVIATSQAELQETLLSDRARFVNWQTNSAPLNVTVNELVQQIESARRRRDQLWARNMTWRKPVEARV